MTERVEQQSDEPGHNEWSTPPEQWAGPDSPDHRLTPPPRILLVYNRVLSSFIAGDLRILRRLATARAFCWRGLTSYPDLKSAIGECDLVFCWFAGRHALAAEFAASREVPVVVVVGGYEAACLPELHYGNARNRLTAFLPRAVLARADAVITVSKSSHADVLNHLKPDGTPLRQISNAIDTSAFLPATDAAREGVVTVSRIDRATIPIKGLDLFARCAELMPAQKFTLVGLLRDDHASRWADALHHNVDVVGEVGHGKIRDFYQRASIYFQGSRHESFAVALAEAMSCGCIPVASGVASLPEIVGDAGVLFDRTEPGNAVDAIKQALAATEQQRANARQRIVDLYDIGTRQERLARLLSDVLRRP